MATHGVPRRDFQALELRRQRAARLFAGGQKTQGAIARLLAVSRQSVMRWYHAWRASGRAGLKAAGRAGRDRAGVAPVGRDRDRLAPRARRGRLHDYPLDAAARRRGHRARDGDPLSPRPRVANPRAAGLDAPAARQAGEGTERRGDSALGRRPLARGKKNARRRRAWLVFQDESGVSQRPPVRRTWAPRGDTPVLIHAFNWKKLSVAAALAFRWDGRRSQLVFQTCPGSYDTPRLIAFLNALKRHAPRRRLVLIWDGLPAHKSREMSAYLAGQRRWLTVERLPGYAPDLNPVELLWGNIKGQELANLCPDDLGDVAAALRAGMARVRRRPTLARAFLKHAGLSF